MPGNDFPSIHSKNAPPATETYENPPAAPALFSAETVSPPPATLTNPPALVSIATVKAHEDVASSKEKLQKL